MSNVANTGTLSVGTEIFNQYQNYNGAADSLGNKNYVVFKGCTSSKDGTGQYVIKIIYFDTP